jgi:hypothetical protein
MSKRPFDVAVGYAGVLSRTDWNVATPASDEPTSLPSR